MCQFKGSMETKIIFALMAQEVDEFKEKDKEHPIGVRNILDDFSNLWSVELPIELPPMHDIQFVSHMLVIDA